MITKFSDKYLIDKVLGDSKPLITLGGSTEKFVPNVNVSWECFSGSEKYFLNLNRKDVTITIEKETFIDGKLSLPTGDIWHINKEEELKWDIEFASKPASNVLEWELKCSAGIEFLYQDTLENEYKKTNDPIFLDSIRPDKVVGSYAVYCDKVGAVTGEHNYFSGQLGFIYRPLVIDALGQKIWATLEIIQTSSVLYTLKITIPQAFLNTAIYPITLDPNLGYTTSGGTFYNSNDYKGIGCNGVQAGSNGTSEKLWVFTHTDSGTADVKLAYYDGVAENDSRLSNSYTMADPTNNQWNSEDISAESLGITNGTSYYPALAFESGGHGLAYNSGSAGDHSYKAGITYANEIVASLQSCNSGALLLSLYLEYQAAGGLSINISDTISIAESLGPAYDRWNLSASESVSITESLTALFTMWKAELSESVSINEALTALFDILNAELSESVAITEALTVLFDTWKAELSDTASITEALTVALEGILPSLSDSANITEALTVLFDMWKAELSDTASVTEALTVLFDMWKAELSDSISITEAITISLTSLGVAVRHRQGLLLHIY